MFNNSASWLTANKAHPLQVRSAPYASPRDGQIVIRNHATAINFDWRIPALGTSMMYKWIKYPCILGSDVAGEVRNNDAEGAFQLYVVLLDHMASPIPDFLPYESACVLPLSVATAACGLFQADQLGLRLPSVNPKHTGETLLVWGGSTSVGNSAIQLAVGAGYEVFATASPRNFDYVKKLGAAQVFNYRSKTVVNDLVKALKGRTVAGAITMASDGTKRCMDILSRCNGKKFVSLAAYPVPEKIPEHFPILRTILMFVTQSLVYWFKAKTMGINYNLIFATSLVENGIGEAIFVDYLPQALEDGRFQAAPEPVVMGNGLESVQDALDYHKSGVSAKKVVVSLKD